MANATFKQVYDANTFTALADTDIIPIVASPFGTGDDGGIDGAVIKEAIRDVVAAFTVAGSDISITHNDPADTLTIAFTGTLYTDADAVAATGFEVVGGDSVAQGDVDLNGFNLLLDSDGDSYIHASADDVLSVFLGGSEKLEIDSTGATDFKATGTDVVTFRSSFSPSPSAVGVTVNFRSEGSSEADAILGRFNYFGKDSASANELYSYFEVIMTDNTAGSEDGMFAVTTIAGGTRSRRFEIRQGLVMQGATGGDKGLGTINATAVYDDNTLLTCYVFDQALDGNADLQKWDAKVPDRIWREGDTGLETERIEVRRHEPLRKFTALIGTQYDPLTLDGYAKHWKDRRHLPSLPDEATFDPVDGQLPLGDWLQRTIETVETQAVLIEQLNTRLKTLETSR